MPHPESDERAIAIGGNDVDNGNTKLKFNVMNSKPLAKSQSGESVANYSNRFLI
jgi:hypothetical protein